MDSLKFVLFYEMRLNFNRGSRLGIRQKNRNLAKPYLFNIIRIGKKMAFP